MIASPWRSRSNILDGKFLGKKIRIDVFNRLARRCYQLSMTTSVPSSHPGKRRKVPRDKVNSRIT
jgi:hypothetical protein